MRRLLTAIILACAIPAWAQSPCDGRITDKLNHPMTPGGVAKPAAGETYVDPVFGTLITRISNANPADGDKAVISTLYNTMRGWNSDGSQIVAWNRAGGGGTYEWYMGDKPYTHLGSFTFGGAASDYSGPADIEHLVWDTTDPNVMYFPATDALSSRKHPRLMKLTLNWPSAPTVSVVRDFYSECTTQGIVTAKETLSLGHGQDMSLDSQKLIGLRCGAKGNVAVPRWDFVYSIASDTILWGYVSNEMYESPPWPFPSGRGSWRSFTKQMYSNAGGVIGTTLMVKSLEHTALGYNAADDWDWVAMSAFDENPAGNLITWRLDLTSAPPVSTIGQGNGWPYPLHDSHPSIGAPDGSGWQAVGMIGSGYGTAGVLDNEIALANLHTGEVCRVAHARSCEDCAGGSGKWNYWSETHPQISNDGYRILFNSDWEDSNTVDIYVVDLRPADASILTTNLPAGVTTEAYSAALSIGGGESPYTCSKTVGSFPAGLSLTGCTISGTPTAVESQTFTIQACDATSPTPVCDTQELTIQIRQRPTITTGGTLPAGDVGSAYSTTFAATGGTSPYTYSVASGSLCEGLTLSSGGTLSGTCVRIGTYNFTVQVTSANTLTNTKAFSMAQSIPSVPLCARLDPIPGSTTAVARMSGSGIPYDASCWVDVRDSGGSLLTTVTATASQVVQLTGLTPSTGYLLDGYCDNGPPHLGVATYTAGRRTLTTQAAGTGSRLASLDVRAPDYAVTQATVSYGSADTLGPAVLYRQGEGGYSCQAASKATATSKATCTAWPFCSVTLASLPAGITEYHVDWSALSDVAACTALATYGTTSHRPAYVAIP